MIMIKYKKNDIIEIAELDSFFQNWKSPPSMRIKQQLLDGSNLVITARDQNRQLVGFLTAITDNAMHAFITLVEVLEDYQRKGIGTQLIKRAVTYFKSNYDIVLITDQDKVDYYRKFGFKEIYGMHIQDFTYGGRIKLHKRKKGVGA